MELIIGAAACTCIHLPYLFLLSFFFVFFFLAPVLVLFLRLTMRNALRSFTLTLYKSAAIFLRRWLLARVFFFCTRTRVRRKRTSVRRHDFSAFCGRTLYAIDPRVNGIAKKRRVRADAVAVDCRLPAPNRDKPRSAVTINRRSTAARRRAVSPRHYGIITYIVGLDYRLASIQVGRRHFPRVYCLLARELPGISMRLSRVRTNICACVDVCVCVRVRLRTLRTCTTYVLCETCKRKRNKATLSWLRLVCCRHEVPVTSEPITVIHMDEDVVVVNKPASIPVSGVLPELYCQKIVCRIVQSTNAFTHNTYIHILSHVLSCMLLDSFHVVKSLDTQNPLVSVHLKNSRSCFYKYLRPPLLKMIPGARFREVKVPLPLNLEFPDSILLHSR